jgi:hypothetical protein
MIPLDDVPPYLSNTDPLEMADLPLQVALLTGELALQRRALGQLLQEMEWPEKIDDV